MRGSQRARSNVAGMLTARIEAGDLTGRERRALARMVMLASAAVQTSAACPRGTDYLTWVTDAWSPVAYQVVDLLVISKEPAVRHLPLVRSLVGLVGALLLCLGALVLAVAVLQGLW